MASKRSRSLTKANTEKGIPVKRCDAFEDRQGAGKRHEISLKNIGDLQETIAKLAMLYIILDF